MKVQLHRYASAVPEHRLSGLLGRPGAIPWEPLGLTVDLSEVRQVSQDLFQAIFERQFGLYPPAAGACVKVLGMGSSRSGGVRRGG